MKLFELIRRCRWDLGIATSIDGHRWDSQNWQFNIIKAPKTRWYADPFILDVTDDIIYVLVEELEYRTNKGRLAKLSIDKKSYEVLDVKIILELPTHLSFPAIYRDGNDVFIYPENSASEKSCIYRYDPKDDTIALYDTLVPHPLTDAIMIDMNGKHYLISTRIPEQNGNTVIIYESLNKFTSYREIQKIELNDNSARSAGDFIKENERIIRPAQNCNGDYGVGLVFQELCCDDEGNMSLVELLRQNPPEGYIGMHTYNTYKGYVVVDLHARRYPLLYGLSRFIKNVLLNKR